MKESVVVKLTSAIAVEGQIVRAGELVELSHAEAVNLLHRGKCTIADEGDISLTEDEQREEVERIQQEQAEAIEQQKRDEAEHAEEAAQKAEEVGYPVVLRPSYVLGGRGMMIVHDREQLDRYVHEAMRVSGDDPVLIDHYLNRATEVDVDALCDDETVFVAGVLEHIEEAGVHSGDSACSLPPHTLDPATIAELKRQTEAMARALNVVGLMNVQFALKDGAIYVLEVNPRASRTVPFVAKATDSAIASIAARLMAGEPMSNFPARAPYPEGVGPEDDLPLIGKMEV